MKKCRLSIATMADGEKSGFLTDGRFDFTDCSLKLRYAQDGCVVLLELKNREVYINREGEYSLFLHLIENQKTQGQLGITGNKGEISVYTYEISYETKEKSLKLQLRYDLLFGGEPQKMRLTILAKEG